MSWFIVFFYPYHSQLNTFSEFLYKFSFLFAGLQNSLHIQLRFSFLLYFLQLLCNRYFGAAFLALKYISLNSLETLSLVFSCRLAFVPAVMTFVIYIDSQTFIDLLLTFLIAAFIADEVIRFFIQFAVLFDGLSHNSLLAFRALLPEDPCSYPAFAVFQSPVGEVMAFINR